MWIRRYPSRTALAALVALMAACDQTTAPDGLFDLDSDGVLADYQLVDSLTEQEALESFAAISAKSPFTPVPVGGPAGAPIISALTRGSTFVYDPTDDRYEIDPLRTDAPETGVRFVLYEVDFLGDPVVGEEIGYADLIDEGDASVEDVVLHLIAVANGNTFIDYRVTLDPDIEADVLGVDGFLRNANGLQLDFDIAAEATKTVPQHLAVDFALGVPARDFSITGGVSGIEDGEDDGHVDVTVQRRGNTVMVDATTEAGVLDGAFYVNEALFATATGDPDQPVVLGADGEPLTFAQLLVLRRILDTTEDVFDFLEDLLDPVEELLVLGIIL